MNYLNYQGNKSRLMDFIKNNGTNYIKKGKALLDIFSGGGAVAFDFAKTTKVYANDLEPYSSQLTKGVLYRSKYHKFDDRFFITFDAALKANEKSLTNLMRPFLDEETISLENEDTPSRLLHLYESIPTIWNGKYSSLLSGNASIDNIQNRKLHFSLFTLLYSNNYFGVRQAIEIDSIRCAINSVDCSYNVPYLFSCLFHAMNAAVFAKDGHMAQPLSPEKNVFRLFKSRRISIYDVFFETLKAYDDLPPLFSSDNKVFNEDFLKLIKNYDLSDVGCVYADPPYTDMQYSRYYHLLNTVYEYKFSTPTMVRGTFTKGLYLENRRQSEISERKSFLPSLVKLMDFCHDKGMNLIISFGYPQNTMLQRTDRYLTSIDNLVESARKSFGKTNVKLIGQDYDHANQRNSQKKKVVEYLILCKGDSHGNK